MTDPNDDLDLGPNPEPDEDPQPEVKTDPVPENDPAIEGDTKPEDQP